jgi:hypothetical protein
MDPLLWAAKNGGVTSEVLTEVWRTDHDRFPARKQHRKVKLVMRSDGKVERER